MNTVAGVDIGGTKIAVGTVRRDGAITSRRTVPTPTNGSDAVLDAVASALRSFDEPCHAVGVGSAGVIDPVSGRVLSSTDALPGWSGTHVKSELSQRLGVPVSVDNDVHAHALGEVWRGAGTGRKTVLFVAVGTGVGASLVLDGSVHHGANAVAGHAGHLAVPEADGVACTCGGRAHVESVASGPSMLDAYRELTGQDDVGLSEISELADQDDATATAVLSRGAVALGRAVGGLANMLDPDLILVGGGVSASGSSWWCSLRETIIEEALPPLKGVPVAAARLGADAPIVGAGSLAWEVLTRGDPVESGGAPCPT